MNNSKGLLIILSGPSGAGKDTVLKELLAHNDKVRVSISATTRQPRQGEENGRDYHFISREQFETLIQRDGVLEYAEYCGNFYGTPRAQVEAWLDEGLDVVLEIEVQGAKKVMAKCPEAVSVFILPPSFAVLEKRLRRRATDSEEAVQKRLAAAIRFPGVTDLGPGGCRPGDQRSAALRRQRLRAGRCRGCPAVSGGAGHRL